MSEWKERRRRIIGRKKKEKLEALEGLEAVRN